MVAGLAVVSAFGVAACEPVGGLSASAVAYTTDRAGTAELQRQHVDVQYLSCTGSYGGGNKAYTPGRTPSASSSTPSVVEVDCRGRPRTGGRSPSPGRSPARSRASASAGT